MRLTFGMQVQLAAAVVALMTACGDASGPKIGPPKTLVPVSGENQVNPPVGDKLPLPLAVRVTDAQGQNVSGVEVVWSTSHGSFSAATSVSNVDGLASVEWTLGPLAGIQTATGTVSGISPVTFTQRAIAGPVSQILLTRDTVELLGIGDAFRMNARPADRFGNTAAGGSTIEATDTSVVTVTNFGSGAFLTARTSNATTTIRATAGSIVKLATVIVLPPPCQSGSNVLTLAVGEIATLTGPAASEFCMQGTPGGAEFTAIPFYSGHEAGSLLRLSISTGSTTIDASPTRLLATRVQSRRAPPSPRLQRDETFEKDLRESSRRELTPRIPLARQIQRQSGGRLSLAVQAPQVGDLMQLNTNSSNPCENARIRTGRVVAITTRAVVVADTTNPADGFTTADFQDFGAIFDTLIYPVDTHNFGEPTDIDNNEKRVLLFFTRAVNELTPPGLNSYVGGFFYSRDLFPKPMGNVGGCAASNAAEMLYLLVPDPAGVINQNVRTTEFVRVVTAGILAHELQHLINASRHLYVNLGSSDFEEGFLDEGLAHIAEEMVFYAATGLASRQNISASTLQSTQRISDAFETFAASNMRRYREFLINPLTNSPYANNTSITTRGAIWAFLRYAADRRGGLEGSAWFELANPPPGSHGIQNLTRVFSAELTAWVRDWAVANYADELVAGVAPTATHPSWDFRSTVAFVNQGSFPLVTQSLDNVSITSVGIGDGSAAYLRFGVAAGVVGGGRITARGAPLPTGYSLSILRTK